MADNHDQWVLHNPSQQQWRRDGVYFHRDGRGRTVDRYAMRHHVRGQHGKPDGVRPCLPTVEKDLPGGARRLVQKAEGIKATLINGAVAFEDGEATGTYAGTVLKGRLAS